MKNAVLTIIALLVLANVKADFVVEGRLSDDLNISGEITKKILTSNREVIKLVNEYIETESCKNGKFEVVEVAEGIFELKTIVNCDQFYDSTKEVTHCPENFMPVCGEIAQDGFDAKSLPHLVTFPNGCELYRAKAAFVNQGMCKI